MADVLVPFISSLVVIDNEGERLFAKYYSTSTDQKLDSAAQKAFELNLFKKTKSVPARSEGGDLLNIWPMFIYLD